jgi:hypothetical protein
LLLQLISFLVWRQKVSVVNITSSIKSFLKEEDDDACTLAAAGDIDDAFNISATDLLIV